MAGWHLDTKMAQDIVARTMRIIDTNINVMDARGRDHPGSGDPGKVGELHEGALLVSRGRVVDIDVTRVARHLHGVRQDCNLPLRTGGGDRRGDRPDRRAGVAANSMASWCA